MQTGTIKRTRIATAIGATLLSFASGQALGAAFALQENSGSAIGNAFAGGAASAEDVSTLWSNPAGLSRLGGPQAALAVHLVRPSFKFRDDGSAPAAFQPLGGTGGDAGDLNVIPNLYIAMPINSQISIGVGVNAPFGLVTEYDDNWLGRFQGIKSDIKTINVNPSLSWRVSNTFAVGVGAHYRSSIKYDVAANVNFDNPALPTLPPALAPVVGQLATGVNAVLANGGVTADIELPDIANVSVFHRLNDRWDLMADAQFTRWSTFKELKFVRTTGALLSNTPENFDDAWRLSVGATYHWNDMWSFRGGLAWDQTPVNTPDRTPRLPDEDRVWIAVGAQYKFNRNLAVDAGFVYIPVKSPDINQNAGSTAANGLIKGTYDANVTIFSAQLTYSF
jgi:long-chain fatty acid transport protein